MNSIIQFPQAPRSDRNHHPLVDQGFSDVFTTTPQDAAAFGFLLASLPSIHGPILWVYDRMSAREAGRTYLLRHVLHCMPANATGVLQAMEDGLNSSGPGAVLGELWGEPRELSFTATKRLALRSQARKVPCILIRHNARTSISAARNRFRIGSLPSIANPNDPAAPGDPCWRVELFRSRTRPPGIWMVLHDRAADRLRFSSLAADGAVGEDRRADELARP
ncbi:hypothetical protein [Roseobacter sp. HKCCA0434]|uniref:hypothetical protein n=1 Tax=Roseobacter sp. HKCCA0434 TaxID=3079297 RepID=UPI00290598C7|nr:hypothetical protein [Roseobacter sp. HKCCA0434]